MDDPVDQGQIKRHTLADWLQLHGLDDRSCREILAAIKREPVEAPAGSDGDDRQSVPLDLDHAWELVISAMREFLPERRGIIEDTFERSEKIAISGTRKSRRALTLDHGPARYPTIMFGFAGTAADVSTMAHEFGHAVQIRASAGEFIPPVMREVCAFLSERALLSYCLQHESSQASALLDRWHEADRRYFGKLTKKLEDCLDAPETIYDYGWNYPIARFLSLRIATSFTPEMQWRVFRGDSSVTSVMEQSAA